MNRAGEPHAGQSFDMRDPVLQPVGRQCGLGATFSVPRVATLDQDLPDPVATSEPNPCSLGRDMVIHEALEACSSGHVFDVLTLEPWEHHAPVVLHGTHLSTG